MLQPTKPFFGFGWIETMSFLARFMQRIKLLNPSSASAGLKQTAVIEEVVAVVATKPFFGFGWIETFDFANITGIGCLLLNPSSASAGLKLVVVVPSPFW